MDDMVRIMRVACIHCGRRVMPDPSASGTDDDPLWTGWDERKQELSLSCGHSPDHQHEGEDHVSAMARKRRRYGVLNRG